MNLICLQKIIDANLLPFINRYIQRQIKNSLSPAVERVPPERQNHVFRLLLMILSTAPCEYQDTDTTSLLGGLVAATTYKIRSDQFAFQRFFDDNVHNSF